MSIPPEDSALDMSNLSESEDRRQSFVASPAPSISSDCSLQSDCQEDPIRKLEREKQQLQSECDALKLKVKCLIEENRVLRQAYVNIQCRAEQEEEFISNTLLKKIETLKREKEDLVLKYEQEEECLTNDLSRKLYQIMQEKNQLEKTLQNEQVPLVNKLMKRVDKLEAETTQKQQNLEQLRREKIELENTLEQEQEALVNKLWKRMDKLESEKRSLQRRLEDSTEKVKSPTESDRASRMSEDIV